jgi:hypothetical protein
MVGGRMKIGIGDTVQRNRDGIDRTVVAIDYGDIVTRVAVTWFDDEEELQAGVFDEEELETE